MRRGALLPLVALLTALTPIPAHADGDQSRVTAVDVTRVEPLGAFGNLQYERIAGTVSGVVSGAEPVAGLRADVRYTSGFELIRPIGSPGRGEVVVEAENRGSPLLLDGLGTGFLFNGGRSYARVQWQTGISPGVPESAQGVGQVIVRDFGRLLRDGGPLGTYRYRLLAGLSQASWFVTSFVAEGFNDAGGQVFQGAYAQDGAGNQLAINAVAAADGKPHSPYIRPDGVPLTPREVLRRPGTDPVFVDAAAHTDYYRLRASVSRQADAAAGYHRYDWPAAHAPVRTPDAAAFVFDRAGCNNRQVVPLNPIDSDPYARALIVALERHIGADGPRLPMPRERMFTAGGEPSDPALLNGLPGHAVSVPQVDGEGFPLGGVPFPATALPLGSPVPPVLTPVSTESISAVCGNFGGWRPYSADQLVRRYGSLDRYLAAYDASATRLVSSRLLLNADRRTLLDQAAADWAQAPPAV